ncbi:MAG TPA: DEAD/DEAH box helicase [Thermoplasmata archaeon]|nr:DEAD/DEAH box helicase [Thermoplasmata archaeon]
MADKAQTRFGQTGTTRQTTLADLLGELPAPETGLVPAPAVPAAPRRPAPPRAPATLRPPTTLREFGTGGRVAREQLVVTPAPREAPPQQTLAGPAPPLTPPASFTAEILPAAVVEKWHLPHELRDYQVTALDAFLNRQKGSVILPTGTGKTLVGIAAILALRLPAVVIVPTRVLVTQWSDELRKAGITPGVWYGEEKTADYVTISTYQSLFDDPELIRGFPLIIFDEGDLATADQFRRLVVETQYHPYALLLTATPPADPLRRRLLETELPIVFQQTSGEAIEAGSLIEPLIVPERVKLTVGEQAAYEKADNTIHAIQSNYKIYNPRDAAIKSRSGDIELRQAAFAFLKAFNSRRRILSEAENKLPALLRVVLGHPAMRVLLFSESIDAIEKSCGYLTAHGITCRLLVSETTARDRADIIHGWGTSFQVLGSVRVLERGFNVPEVSVGIIIASGSGRTQLTQRIGRIVRPSPGKNAAWIYVILASETVEENMLKALYKLTGKAVDQGGPPSEDSE